jgi:hypothetical protein
MMMMMMMIGGGGVGGDNINNIKIKAVLVIGRGGLLYCETSRLPYFPIGSQMAVRLSVLITCCPSPPTDY